MTKLAQIKAILEAHPNISIVATRDNNHLPKKSAYWSHVVEFFIAPAPNGVYIAEELREILCSLFPDIPPTMLWGAEQSGSMFNYGTLVFDEVIGKKTWRTTFELTDETLFSANGFTDGKLENVQTEEVSRRTFVHLFPDQDLAKDAFRGKNVPGIHIDRYVAHVRKTNPEFTYPTNSDS